MGKIISIIKEKHFGTFKHVPDSDIHGNVLRLCEYKVFTDNAYGQIRVYSALNDFYIENTVFPYDADIKPLQCKIDMPLLMDFIKNEKDFSQENDSDFVEKTVLGIVAALADNPLVTNEVREYLRHKGMLT